MVDVGNVGCTSTQHQCNNGKCISSALQCDHNNDCGDLSDEFGCGKRSILNLNQCHVLSFSPVQLHATTLSCNAVMVTVLIKAMPVTIDHLTAITIMMKAFALVS